MERPTEPPDLVQADQGAAERGEGEVDVCAAFVAPGQVAGAGAGGRGHDPPKDGDLDDSIPF